MIEFIFGSIGSLIVPYTDSYLKKHPTTGYINAFFIGFACAATPFMLCGLMVLDNKGFLNRLLISSSISGAAGLAFGLIAVIFLFSMRRSMIKNAKSQLLNQNSL
jgi:hypothetical protein